LDIPENELFYDPAEEPEIIKLLRQTHNAKLGFLNDAGYADYAWKNHEKEVMHIERKTWRDLIYGPKALDKVEDLLARQLRKYRKARLRLLIQGVALASPLGTTVFRAGRGANKIFIPIKRSEGESKIPTNSLTLIYSWLYQVGKYVEIYPSFDNASSAHAISSFFKADQKAQGQHTTFHRYLNTLDWHPDPQVMKLMAIADGIGAVKAQALLDKFRVVWKVVSASPEELMTVPGIGSKLAHDILRKIGRPDIDE
jgi:hypothetical protein